MLNKNHISILLMFISIAGFGQFSQKDSLSLEHIFTIQERMVNVVVNGMCSDDTTIKYSMQCLAVNRRLAEYAFIDIYIVQAYFNKKQYDSACKYGDIFLKQKVKKAKDDDNELAYSHYGRGRNFQLETSDILFQIDTTRHKYKQAAKYLVTHNPEQWWYGSGTNFRGKMKRYYTNILYCYVQLGDGVGINKYKKKLEQYE